MPRKPSILLCTVGTSLKAPTNLAGRRTTADGSTDWAAVAADLADADPADRACGAEVNSIASLVAGGHVPPDVGIYFLHSDTPDGSAVAAVLADHYHGRGHSPVTPVPLRDLADADPRRFRTHGLRNLARELCRVIRDHDPAACGINATGGYKAQIAVAVLIGQAVGVPVFYMHERFAEVIEFPPLPVALDFDVWMQASGLLTALADPTAVHPRDEFTDEWDERFDTLVDEEEIDGRVYLTLSPAGQIFHDTLSERFRTHRAAVLPPPADRKHPPRYDHGHVAGLADLRRLMERVTDDVPQVVQCGTYYHNPSAPAVTRFRLGSKGVECIWSDGRETVKFRVDTTAKSDCQQKAVVAALNEWLAR